MENQSITLKDVIPKTAWPEIWKELLTHHPYILVDSSGKQICKESDLESGYMAVFTKLNDIVEIPSDLVLIIKMFEQEYGQYKYSFDPAAYNEECPGGYSMMASPWGEWLGLTISPETLEQYSYAEIIAHCLYEMTWFGGSEAEVDATCDYI